MIVKGIIKTIDYSGNTCEVRLPLFESAGNTKEVIIPATFSTLPGLYNGYKVDDVVFVTFENETLNSPIILGKLYLGADLEGKDPRGAINAENLKSLTPMSLPLDTKLILDNDPKKLNTVKVKNGISDYKTIADIVKGLQKQETQIGSINAQLIDTGDSIGFRVSKLEKDDARHESEIIANADAIENSVVHITNGPEGETKNGLGWTLDTESWTLNQWKNNVETTILEANENGLTVTGTINADAGEIAGFTIGDNSTEQQYKYILFKSAEENPSASGIVGIHYTQEECDEYNTEHDLSEGDEGFRTTDDWKEAPGTGYIGYYIIKYIPNTGFKYRLVETVEDLEGVTLPVATYTRAIDGIGGGKYLRAPFESDLGTPGSVFISPEYKGTIPTLDNNRQGWAFIAGENFGVNTDGQLFAHDATLKQYVKFTPTVTSSDPEHPVDVQDELRISAQQTDFGTITIRCFVDYKHEQEWSFDHYKPEVFDPLDPGWIDITDPGWGGGGSSGGGSSSGGGGGFTPLPGPGHNTGPSGGGTTF